MANITKGGHPRKLSRLEVRRADWDKQKSKNGTKRPGSHKKSVPR
jgi:hypothetical protein